MNPEMIMQLLGMAGGGGGSSMGTMGVGLVQTLLGAMSARKLAKIERPEYNTNPELYQSANRAEQRAQYGFAPNQVAAYQNNLGRAMNTDYYNNRNMAGGGLAQTLTGRQTGQRLNSLNQFASDDASRMQSNIQYSDSLRKYLQSQSNMQQQQKINYRMNDERNAGATLSSGLNNIGSAANSMQSLGGGGGGQQQGGGISQPNTGQFQNGLGTGGFNMPQGTPSPQYYGNYNYDNFG